MTEHAKDLTAYQKALGELAANVDHLYSEISNNLILDLWKAQDAAGRNLTRHQFNTDHLQVVMWSLTKLPSRTPGMLEQLYLQFNTFPKIKKLFY